MKTSKFSPAQQAFILNRAIKVCRWRRFAGRPGIGKATSFTWRKKYTGLLPAEMCRLKALEDENSQLKKIVAGLTPDHDD